MKAMKASEFKAKCLQVMDDVEKTGVPVIVTKNGRPVSRLEPFRKRPTTAFGALKGAVEIVDEIVSPIDVEWEAEQ